MSKITLMFASQRKGPVKYCTVFNEFRSMGHIILQSRNPCIAPISELFFPQIIDRISGSQFGKISPTYCSNISSKKDDAVMFGVNLSIGEINFYKRILESGTEHLLKVFE